MPVYSDCCLHYKPLADRFNLQLRITLKDFFSLHMNLSAK